MAKEYESETTKEGEDQDELKLIPIRIEEVLIAEKTKQGEEGEGEQQHIPSILEKIAISRRAEGEITLHFPTSLECTTWKECQRSVMVPDKFETKKQYINTFLSAIYEEMNLNLLELATHYHQHYNDITNEFSMVARAPSCKTCGNKCTVKYVKKQGKNKNKPFYCCTKKGCTFFVCMVKDAQTDEKGIVIKDPDERRESFRKREIALYNECKLVRSKKTGKLKVFLVLSHLEDKSVYSKYDTWLISTKDDTFNHRPLIAQSLYFGPSKDGLIELEILEGYIPKFPGVQDNVFAIRGNHNFTSEMKMCNHLRAMQDWDMPILNTIMGNVGEGETSTFPRVAFERVTYHLEQIMNQYDLNDDQKKVLYEASEWLYNPIKVPILLIHGTYGSGKSFLLSAIVIQFLCAVFDDIGDTTQKILITSITNVAVDNLLVSLLDHGFDNFLRVGSIRKMAKRVLPHTLVSDKHQKSQLKELKQMLKEPHTDEEIKSIRDAIDSLKGDIENKKRKQLDQVRVVGVTCAACTFPVMEGAQFSIVIQDEASQILEPLSVLPVVKFGCQRLLLVGDPLQLPPTLSGSSHGLPNESDSLEKTLFVRLANCGLSPLMLQTQYRCHPLISEISNVMFYGKQLTDGITQQARAPLIPMMPPVIYVNTQYITNNGVTTTGLSIKNEAESRLIIHLVNMLVQRHQIEPKRIGIIALYRAQAFSIKSKLLKHINADLRGIKVSSVDGYQGAEADIIILSCTRTSQHVNAFFESRYRINVALTRAKRHLFLIGHDVALRSSTIWSTIIAQAERVKGLLDASRVLKSSSLSSFWNRTQDVYVLEPLTSSVNVYEEMQTALRRKRTQPQKLKQLRLDELFSRAFKKKKRIVVRHAGKLKRVSIAASKKSNKIIFDDNQPLESMPQPPIVLLLDDDDDSTSSNDDL